MKKKVSLNQLKKILSESKHILKEGAGAWYTITIEDLQVGNPVSIKETDEREVYEFIAPVIPGKYAVVASSYNDQYFPQDPDDDLIRIDGGQVRGRVWVSDADVERFGLEPCVENSLPVIFTLDAVYGHGSSHVYLPDNGKIVLDDVRSSDDAIEVDVVKLRSEDMAEKVNTGYAAVNY